MLYKNNSKGSTSLFLHFEHQTQKVHTRLYLWFCLKCFCRPPGTPFPLFCGGVFIQTQALRRLVEFSTDSDRVLSPNDRPLVLQALITYCITLHRLMESYVFCVTVLEMNARLCASTFPWHPCSWIAVYLWNLWKKNQRCFKRRNVCGERKRCLEECVRLSCFFPYHENGQRYRMVSKDLGCSSCSSNVFFPHIFGQTFWIQNYMRIPLYIVQC